MKSPEESIVADAKDRLLQKGLPFFKLGSPVDVTWQGPAGTLTLRQQTGGLSGTYPMLLLPAYERDSSTWGVVWLDLTQSTCTLSLKAVHTGTLHVSRVDPASGQVATYIARVVTGEVLRLRVAPGVIAPVLVRSNGRTVAPVVTRFVRFTGKSVATSTPAPRATSTPAAHASEQQILNNWNTGGVGSRPTAPTVFSITQPYLITEIVDYHWNGGNGQPGGTIALRSAGGHVYGPWRVKTSGGSSTVNIIWTARPKVEIPAGTYTVVDSSPATWSQNAESGGRGFSQVRGVPVGS